MKYGPVIEGTKELKDLQPTTPNPENGGDQGQDEGKMPPVIRSVLELTHSFMSSQSQKLRMCPGYQGGLFYRGKPYCFACGYRDGTRGLDMDDKGNHLRLKDPCVVGSLSIPITAMLVGQLHDEGRMTMDQPIVELLPELNDALSGDALDQYRLLTPRSILSFESQLDEKMVFKHAGVQIPKITWGWNPSKTYYETVTTKVDDYFGIDIPGRKRPVKKDASKGGSALSAATLAAVQRAANGGQSQATVDMSSPKVAAQYRKTFVQYLGSTRGSVPAIRVAKPALGLGRAHVPHFTMALLTAAIDRALEKKAVVQPEMPATCTIFEEAMNERLFKNMQALSAGYGPPRPWRDPTSIFYTPTGQTAGHMTFGTPVPLGDPTNAGSPLFNASMNLYAPIEEFASLLMTAIDMTHKTHAGAPNSPKPTRACIRNGLYYEPSMDTYLGLVKPFSGIDLLPYAASMRYMPAHDLGTFCVVNAGMRRSRWFTRTGSKATETIFINNIIKKGVVVETTTEEDESVKQMQESVEKLQTKKKPFSQAVDAHRRF
jgi:hypothetical protein